MIFLRWLPKFIKIFFVFGMALFYLCGLMDSCEKCMLHSQCAFNKVSKEFLSL